jgi:hypothetical protein
MNIVGKRNRVYYLNGYVRIEAVSDEEALKRFERAGLGIEVEIEEGVTLDFQGPWDEIEEIADDCVCPPDLLARGGFKGGCPVHG